MDKNTLSNYGWIVIAVLVLSVMIALATPFGSYIENGVRSTVTGLFDTSEKAMNVVGMTGGSGNMEDGYQGVPKQPFTTLTEKDWGNFIDIQIKNIWTDGVNTYYSDDSQQYVLQGDTWVTKTWNGLTSFLGSSVWTDGANIYYSNTSTQYVLDKATSTWEKKTWTGLTSFNGNRIWADGTYYYSYGSKQYQFS